MDKRPGRVLAVKTLHRFLTPVLASHKVAVLCVELLKVLELFVVKDGQFHAAVVLDVLRLPRGRLQGPMRQCPQLHQTLPIDHLVCLLRRLLTHVVVPLDHQLLCRRILNRASLDRDDRLEHKVVCFGLFWRVVFPGGFRAH